MHLVLRKSKEFQRTISQLWNQCLRKKSTDTERKRLIILGTGWASYSVLKAIDKRIYDVIVVSPRNHFLFTPLLCSTTVGTLEFRSIIEPVRNQGFRQTDHFNLSWAESLDFSRQILHCHSALKPDLKYELSYDKIVIGVGALNNTFGVPGVHEYAIFLKEVADARKIRNRIIHNFELSVQPGIDESESKRLLHTIIVGGGPTGIEFGAELYDFIEQDVARLYKRKRDDVQVTLVESNKILSSFDERLRHFAEKKIKQRSGFNLLKDSVTNVSSDHVVLKSGKTIPCGLVVWSTGLAPRSFVVKLNVAKNSRGQILTDRHLRILDDPSGNSYALGDCADIQDMLLPCTAQLAEKQGRYLAEQLNGKGEGKPFKFRSRGMLAYIGQYQGLTDLPEFKLQGFPSWFLWRSAYLTRLGSWRLIIQVPLDWIKTHFFGRDISRID
ncbi:hypothetical protein CHS0354_038884 [Potamilus streckersoni]|uniref:FAD/NAD(P)-binding domain-containing protein n=1 Tax=Potamilus streckersoni TaxID=2493646 RepID=A0AAE0VZU6_9BIVA|nr:hypothetical protein CHS0354_038884 [Potamilus streckersoni]